ncbi:MAG: substrate-binding periplasmic protein [Campylobacterota bacterium]
MAKILLIVFIVISGAFAKEVSVVFSRTIPPYVFKDDSGFKIDVVKEALSRKGHSVKSVFVNIARGAQMFEHKLVDANSLVQQAHDGVGYYSDIFMRYHNKVFTLEDANLSIQAVTDIANFHTIAFQNARVYLGDAFTNSIKDSKIYSEQADQKLQVYMLYKGRTQAVILDENVFAYYTQLLIDEGKIAKDMRWREHDIFTPTDYQVVFQDKQIRDDFNEGLAQIKADGTYDMLRQRYKTYFKR